MLFFSFILFAEEGVSSVSTENLPKDKYTLVDGAKSVEDSFSSPLGLLEGTTVGESKIPKPFIIKSKTKTVTDVLFSHGVHTYWFNCNSCHPSIFKKKRGETKGLTMSAIFKGEFCGRCHDKVAFRTRACYMCHLPSNARKREEVLNRNNSKEKFYANLALLEKNSARKTNAEDVGGTLSVQQTLKPPIINGDIVSKEWNEAASVSNFWVFEQQRLPSEKTEVLVLADEQHLYIGFRCFDTQPHNINALETRRDSGFGMDDQVVVELDTFHNHRDISSYYVNAIGTQGNTVSTGRANNLAWKGNWKAAAVRTEYGWSAEIMIPLSILNYPHKANTFGVNFRRYHRRTDEWSLWPKRGLISNPEEMGHLTGLILPEKNKLQSWTVMPYVIAGKNIPDHKDQIKDTQLTGGVDIRYEPKPNTTGIFTLYPDFTQIETQVASIDFDYNEKSLADSRPFFQEGSAYFGNDEAYFYSNRIPAFNVGAKYFAQVGQFQVGALATSAADNRKDFAIRLSQGLDINHHGDIILIGTNKKELDNQLIVGRLRGQQSFGLKYGFDVARTNTNIIAGDGDHGKLFVDQNWDYFSIGAAIDHYNEGFLSANGLVKQDLLDTNGVNTYISYYRDLSTGAFRILSGEIGWKGRDTSDGLMQRRQWYTGGSIELRRQIQFGLYYTGDRYLPSKGEAGSWASDLNNDYYWDTSLDFNTRSSRLGFGASYTWGMAGGGDYTYLKSYVWLNPTNKTSVSVSTERVENFGLSNQFIASAVWDISSQSGLSTRFILADNNRYYRIAYTLHATEGRDVFFVYDDEPGSPTKISIKFVASFQ